MNSVLEFTPTFRAALSQRERRPLARVTYCDLLWNAQEVISGQVTPDSDFALDDKGHRRISLRLWNQDGARTPDPESETWFGRFMVEWGLRTAAGMEWVNLGRYVATAMGARVGPTVGWASLGLESPSALWGRFKEYWVISGNTRIVDAITAIAGDAGVPASELNLYPTEEIVGADVVAAPGDSRWDLARRIAAAGAEVGLVLNLVHQVDRYVLYPEADPATSQAVAWTFRRSDNITAEIDKRWEDSDFANRIQVYGGSGKSATIFSEIADTSGGPYGTQRRGDQCFKWPEGQEMDPLITTQARADARRDYLYRLKRTSQELIGIRGQIVPGLGLGNVVGVNEPQVTRTNARYTLRGCSFGLGPSGSMSLTARRVVMP